MAQVEIHQAEVLFNPLNETLKLNGFGVDHTLTLGQGIHMIVLTLKTELPDEAEGPGAMFPAYPVVWVADAGEPIRQPDYLQVQWHDASHFTIVDFNTVSKERRHRFNILVSYGGKTYGSDPTIINEPPIQT